MEILQNLTIILACIVAITKGADWLVESAAKIGRQIGISELVLGLTVVAFGTSAPEFGVTILAAFRNSGDISVGNIVGSNIFNLGFILGGVAIIHSLKTSRSIVWRDGAFLLIGTILLIVFLRDLCLSRLEGIFLFSFLFVYLFYLFREKQPATRKRHLKGKLHWRDLLRLILAIGIVLTGSHFLVEFSIRLAIAMHVSQWVIGVTLVAAGTSVPELAVSFAAAFRGHHDISIGNLIGSNIFNLFGVLGVAGTFHDLTVGDGAKLNLINLLLMTVIVLIFMRSGWQISRGEGVFLFLTALACWGVNFLI